MTYFQGDNFQAFNLPPITIDLEDEQDKEECSKAYVVFNDGILVKEYSLEKGDLIFPLEVEITEQESKKLPLNVYVNLIVIDKQNRPKTCDGVLKFRVEKEVKTNESNI